MANEKEWQQDISTTVDVHTADLANHENRLNQAELNIANHEKRIDNIETTSDVGQFATRIQAVEDKNTEQDSAIDTLKKNVSDNLQTATQYTDTKLTNYTTKTENTDTLEQAKQYTNSKADTTLEQAKADASQKYLPLTGGALSGSSSTIRRTVDDDCINIYSGTQPKGACLIMSGKDRPTWGGEFHLLSTDDTHEYRLIGTPRGTLTWGDRNLIRSVNKIDADNNGNVSLPLPYLPLAGGKMSGSIRNNSNSGTLELYGGDNFKNGATIQLMGKDYPDYELNGGIALITVDKNGGQSNRLNLQSDGTLTWRFTEINPVGEVCFFASSSIPTGYLLCNGAAVSRTTYAKLFSAIGTKYGSGDGSTTFNLPNLINKFAQGSTTVGTVKNAGLPNISADFSSSGMENVTASGALTITSSSAWEYQHKLGTVISNYTLNLSASKSSSIYGNSTTVQPPALTLLPCIRY